MAVGIHAARGDRPVPQRTGRVISRTGAHLLAAPVGILALMRILASLLIHGSVPSFLGRADTQISQWTILLAIWPHK